MNMATAIAVIFQAFNANAMEVARRIFREKDRALLLNEPRHTENFLHRQAAVKFIVRDDGDSIRKALKTIKSCTNEYSFSGGLVLDEHDGARAYGSDGRDRHAIRVNLERTTVGDAFMKVSL